MRAELYVFIYAFDVSFVLRNDLDLVLSESILHIVMIDSHTVFQVIAKNTLTTEKCLIIDVRAAREAYEARQLLSFG